MADGIKQGQASAVCTQNIYHFTETSIKSAKQYLNKAGIDVRLPNQRLKHRWCATVIADCSVLQTLFDARFIAIVFDEGGVCNACHNADAKAQIDWDARQQGFWTLSNRIGGTTAIMTVSCHGPAGKIRARSPIA